MNSKQCFKFVAMALILCVLPSIFGCMGKTVPPATVVVIKDSGGNFNIIRDGNYHAYGRDLTIYIDGSINKFDEDTMHILCKDQIPVIMDVKYFGQFDLRDDESVKKILSIVKPTSTSDSKIYRVEFATFYKAVIQSTIRSTTRSVVAPYNTDNLQDLRGPIENELNKQIAAEIKGKGFPVVTTGLKVSDLDYETDIKNKKTAIKNAELDDLQKAAEAQARTREAERQTEIAIKEGEAQVERARATAKANAIVGASLTPAILALEQYKMYEEMAKGPNNTFMLAPYDALTSKNFGQVTSSAMLYKQTFPTKE
jgi:regulator of protease activity HflC (stomatin/prohibitin superfamily)